MSRNNYPQGNLGTSGSEHTMRGRLNKWGGKLQEAMGKFTGKRGTQARGTGRQAGGSIQEGFGKTERRADDVLNEKP